MIKENRMIREAALQDIEPIAHIIIAAWKTAYIGIVDQAYADTLNISKYINIFTDNIKNKKEIILVNDENGVNGFISGVLHDDKYDCEVIGLYVAPEHQQKGIGKSLLKNIIEVFKKLNKKNMIIWTLNDAKNNSFYLKMGGCKKEYKKLIIGGKTYQGVGFHFNIQA